MEGEKQIAYPCLPLLSFFVYTRAFLVEALVAILF